MGRTDRGAMGRSRGRGFREGDLELDADLVLELERAEEADVGLDPEARLDHGGRAAVPAGPGLGHLHPDRLALPVEGDRALHGAAAGADADHPGGGETGRAGAEDLGHLLLDLAAVPVGERLGAAGPPPDLQRAEVDIGLDRRRGDVVIRYVDLRGPASDLDGQVVAGHGGEALAAGLEHQTPVVRPEPVVTCSSHGADCTGSGRERSSCGALRRCVAAVRYGRGKSPNSSRIRRRSRSRGSVVPPTQRLTVLTETPSWRAATSMVMPSRRSEAAIQSAKAVSSSSGGATSSRPTGPCCW